MDGLIELLAAGPTRLERELQVQNRLIALLLMTKGQGAPDFGHACARGRELCQFIGDDDELFNTFFALVSVPCDQRSVHIAGRG